MEQHCDGCGRIAGPDARSHRHHTICLICLQVAFNLGFIKSHCPEQHEFTEDNTMVTKAGWWQCRTCHRDQARDRYWAKKKSREAKRATESA